MENSDICGGVDVAVVLPVFDVARRCPRRRSALASAWITAVDLVNLVPAEARGRDDRGGESACVAAVVVGVVGIAGVSAFLLSGYFCCQLRREQVNAKLVAKSFQRGVVALEDEMAEQVGHLGVVAARAAGCGRRACQFAVEFRQCHELVCSFPCDETALASPPTK